VGLHSCECWLLLVEMVSMLDRQIVRCCEYTVCVDRMPEVSCSNSTPQVAYANGTCYNGTELVGVWNETIFENVTHLKRTSASEEYYK